MIGFGENIGSGFPLILSAWDEKHWLRPELIEQPELLQVKLILTIENKITQKDSQVDSGGKNGGNIGGNNIPCLSQACHKLEGYHLGAIGGPTLHHYSSYSCNSCSPPPPFL